MPIPSEPPKSPSDSTDAASPRLDAIKTTAHKNRAMTVIRAALLPGALTALCMAAASAAAGNSLGLFIAGFFVVTFIAPAAALTNRCPFTALVSIAFCTAIVAIFWMLAIFRSQNPASAIVPLLFLLASFSLLISSLASAACRCGLPSPIAAAITIALASAWLTWPVWLSPQLSRFPPNTVQQLVEMQPILVANGLLADEPPWTERPVAYQLTTLNQDVPMELPTRAWPATAAHGGAGILLLIVALSLRRRSRAATDNSEPH